MCRDHKWQYVCFIPCCHIDTYTYVWYRPPDYGLARNSNSITVSTKADKRPLKASQKVIARCKNDPVRIPPPKVVAVSTCECMYTYMHNLLRIQVLKFWVNQHVEVCGCVCLSCTHHIMMSILYAHKYTVQNAVWIFHMMWLLYVVYEWRMSVCVCVVQLRHYKLRNS
jgi:hypothetical protein